MNTLLEAMKENSNIGITENGGITRVTTGSNLCNLFALGGAYRTRSDEDCILLFKKAFEEDEVHALRCLFYLRDCRGQGQGERRFFRVVMKWLANERTEAARRNLKYVPTYGRWDDLYTFVNTPLEKEAFDLMYHQLALDVECKTPSLLAKWLKSENTSSEVSRELANKTRKAFGMTSKQYRKTLAKLRERIHVLERLMSENRWQDIEFDKIPSKAGIIYRNAFSKHDIERAKSEKDVQTYEEFAKDKTTKVNAKTLYPCDVVHEVTKNLGYWKRDTMDETQRLIVQKYWNNLENYFKNAIFNGVAVVDTSSSMAGGYGSKEVAPIDVAIALGMYCAEKCNPKSPWYGHYITFSNKARLVAVEGVDFYDKVKRIYMANLCENTNIESVFSLLLTLAVKNRIPQSEMPKNIVIVSDMEFDAARGSCFGWYGRQNEPDFGTVMERIMKEWQSYGYEAPHLVFWNVQARQDNIPMKDNGNVTFVSGYSATLFEQLLTGKTGVDFVLDKLDSPRYQVIH